MNKLLGFFELKQSSLPTIPWKEYNKSVNLDSQYLWTIRTAVLKGNDLNLPRLVGASANNAKEFADDIYNKYNDSGMVIYYPYFIAEKSGTMNIYQDKTIIEAVYEDLWNLVTNSDREVTIQIENDSTTYYGNEKFFIDKEFDELSKYIPRIKAMFREYILEGKSILLEWSFAYKSDISKNKVGDKYLVFYEVRTV